MFVGADFDDRRAVRRYRWNKPQMADQMYSLGYRLRSTNITRISTHPRVDKPLELSKHINTMPIYRVRYEVHAWVFDPVIVEARKLYSMQETLEVGENSPLLQEMSDVEALRKLWRGLEPRERRNRVCTPAFPFPLRTRMKKLISVGSSQRSGIASRRQQAALCIG